QGRQPEDLRPARGRSALVTRKTHRSSSSSWPAAGRPVPIRPFPAGQKPGWPSCSNGFATAFLSHHLRNIQNGAIAAAPILSGLVSSAKFCFAFHKNGRPGEPPILSHVSAVNQLPAPPRTVTARRFCDQHEMSSHTATGLSLP